jgi:hypothetical protein
MSNINKDDKKVLVSYDDDDDDDDNYSETESNDNDELDDRICDELLNQFEGVAISKEEEDEESKLGNGKYDEKIPISEGKSIGDDEGVDDEEDDDNDTIFVPDGLEGIDESNIIPRSKRKAAIKSGLVKDNIDQK